MMNRTLNNKILIPSAIIAVLLVCLGLYFVRTDTKGSTVRISKDGKVIRTVDLSAVKSPYVIDLGRNTVLIERDAISMESAQCPDKLCVRQGKLKRGGAIVCLPNKIMIEYVSHSKDTDAVAGAR